MESDIGFIGVGNMGFHMAGNIRKEMPRTSTLHIFDVVPASCQRFVDKFEDFGEVLICTSPKEVAANAKTVVSMVPSGDDVRQVYLDPQTGIIAAPADEQRLLLECSTIEIATTQQVGQEIMSAGRGTYVDTPVSGGTSGAEAGTLSFFLGHARNDNADSSGKRIWETISFMGATDRINFCGSLGAGLSCKIANNYASLANMVVAAQAMAIGVRHGVDRKILYECIRGSSGGSWILDNLNPVPGVIDKCPSSNGYRQSFSPRLGVKDMMLGINAAKDVGLDPTMGEEALKLFKLTAKDPLTTHLDFSAVWLHINHELDSVGGKSSV